jgi:hypothetical protein
MFSSVEIRWFYPGAIPPDVLAWYHDDTRHVDLQPRRVDHYLPLPGSDSLGVKLREGRIEVKQRHQAYGLARLDERVEGRAEGWRKWSFPLSGGGSPQPQRSETPPGWTSVCKERALARYRLTEDRVPVPVPAGELFQRGCDLELARVQVNAQVEAWWTLALEAFGEEQGLVADLLAVAAQVFAVTEAKEAPILQAGDSLSYPAWLRPFGRERLPG